MTTAALQDMFLPDDRCFGCGPANADGLHLKSYEHDGLHTAEWTPEERFEGPSGVVNGGVMAIPMDCLASWAAMHVFSEARGGEAVGAVTAEYYVRLARPTPLGHRVGLVAEVVEEDAHRARVHVAASVDGEEVAAFHGTYVCVDQP